MKRRPKAPGTLRFIFIAVVLMLLADQFIFGGTRSYIEEAKQASHKKEAKEAVQAPPVRVVPPDGKAFFEAPPMAEPDAAAQAPDTPVPPTEAPPEEMPEQPKPETHPAPVPQAALPKPSVHGKPKVAIIIDDVGMDVKRSKEAINLPAGVTLAYLPYAPRVKELAALGKEKGHTLIIHTPMEAVDTSLNIGPGGLRGSMSPSEREAAFGVMLNSFSGYEGINNHMGSLLTQNKPAMDAIMKTLAARGLFFVDSKTVGSSVAAHEAAEEGVPYAERDVFLDHVETADFAHKALAHVEALALRRGYAIAIGHPKDNTLAALRAWIPTLEAKGIELVSVKELLVVPKAVRSETEIVPVVPLAVESEVPAPEVQAEPPVDLFPEDVRPSYRIPTVSAPEPSGPVPQSLPPQTQSPAP